MFDFSMTQIVLIAVTALVCIGPKELPGALRSVGKMVGKARGMAREFQTNVDDMMRESELDEVKKQVQRLEYEGVDSVIEKTVDPKGELRQIGQTIESASAEPVAPATAPAIAAPAPAPVIEAATKT